MGGILDHRGWARSNGGLWLPRLYHSPNEMGFCCCATGCDPPGCWSFGVSGFSDDACSDCEFFNRTWYLAYKGTVGSTSTWSCTISEYCSDCGDQTIALSISDTTITLTCLGVTWSKTITSAAEAYCTSHVLAYQSNSGGCAFDEADVTITPGYNAQGLCPCPTYCPGSPCESGNVFAAGTTPKYTSVSISGVTNRNCTNCAAVDGSYILTQTTACHWHYAGPPKVCGGSYGDWLYVDLDINSYVNNPYCDSGDIQVLVEFSLYWYGLFLTARYVECIEEAAKPIDGTALALSPTLISAAEHCYWPSSVTVG